MSLGTFILVKNEILWIKDHINNVLPYVDEMVFFDGNSTDGTRETIEGFNSPKIKLFLNKDPKDLRDDYVRLFNDCLHTLSTDWAWFHHPDMWVENPDQILKIKELTGTAMFVNMTSYGGDPGGPLYKVNGRSVKWKNIYRLNNPDLGAHYHGWYGAWNEDVYFKSITGNSHYHHGIDTEKYPYKVIDSGLIVHHFSDVRPHNRRVSRMKTCLLNQGYSEYYAQMCSREHPRVTFIDSNGLKFEKVEWDKPCFEHLKEKSIR